MRQEKPPRCLRPRFSSSIPASAASPCSARSPRAAGRELTSMSPTMPHSPTATSREDALITRVVQVIGKAIAAHTARPGGHRLQHRLDAGARRAARALCRALRRHRAGDQAGLRAVEDQARRRAGHAGDRVARIYPRADPRIRRKAARSTSSARRGSPPSPRPNLPGPRPPMPTSPPKSPPASSDEDGRRTDTVVLACTHYPLLGARFRALAPWPVAWLDPAAAIARRVTELIGPPSAAATAATAHHLHLRQTALVQLAAALAGYGFSPAPLAEAADLTRRRLAPYIRRARRAFGPAGRFATRGKTLRFLRSCLSVPAEMRDRGGRGSSTR